MKCENCKYWDKEPEEYMTPFRRCLHEKLKDVSGHFDSDLVTGDMLLTEDYESYAAKILTGPKFGCIHFDKKVNT